ncbi:MBL fold metallo-hydrolase [Emydomyces testavorans]|uniref:MBL fold metallo-hydrolase n=1 Tax=Emydomyces testavorans TaxID=2070801 RepID=A0AAF0DHZ0_9EURO|nr:MBL fold metallo-hydrolase [Emydomyces testavorans]
MASLVEVDSLDVTVIVDNELDIMSPPPPDTIQSTGLMGNIALESPYNLHDRGDASTELRMGSICCSAHGLSVMITATKGDVKHTMLFDTGPEEDVWERNVSRLRADISAIERIQLSHWHRDHSANGPAGGMLRAIRMIKDAQAVNNRRDHDPKLVVDLHGSRPDYRGFTIGSETISLEADPTFEEIEHAGAKVERSASPHTVLDDMFLISGEIPRATEYETGLKHAVRFDKATGTWEKDELIADERLLVCNVKGKGIVIFTGCSHAGVVNASRHAVDLVGRDVPVYAIFGGYHLATSEDAQVHATVRDLKALEPRILLPGHCSGWRVKYEIEKEMPGRLIPPSVGAKLAF